MSLSAVLTLLCGAAAVTASGSFGTVFITGANRGIGKEMSRKLAAEGKQVIHSCRNPTLCKESAVELRKSTGNPDIQVLLLDVTNEDSLKSAVDEVKEFYDEEIDVLINNAGIFVQRYENRSEWTEEDFNKTLETNFKGAVDTTLALVPYMKENSSVLMVSSGFSRRRFLVDPFYLDCVNSASTLEELWKDCKVFRPESKMKDEEGPAYKISKVMLNRAVQLLAGDPLLTVRNITINAGNPGTTKTRMAPDADKTAPEGAESLLWIVRKSLNPFLYFGTGNHYDQDEQELEW